MRLLEVRKGSNDQSALVDPGPVVAEAVSEGPRQRADLPCEHGVGRGDHRIGQQPGVVVCRPRAPDQFLQITLGNRGGLGDHRFHLVLTTPSEFIPGTGDPSGRVGSDGRPHHSARGAIAA